MCGALACTLLACGAIIGTRDDLTYDPDAAGGGGSDAAANADATGGGNTDGSMAKDTGAGDASSSDGAATCPGVDLTTDDKNCGACNHDCLGGKCMTSKCQPAKLFSGGISPYALAVDSTNVYFSDITAGAVYTMPKNAPAPSTATKIADTPDPLVYDIVADTNGIGVYFSWGSSSSGSKGALEAIAPDGGNRRALMQDASIARGLSMDNINVFFALSYFSPAQVGFIARTATNGTPQILSANEPDTDNTHVSGGYLYWGGESKTTVRSCTTNQPPTGCNATLGDFVTGLNASEALGGNTKNVFISGYDILYQAAKGSTSATGVAQNQPQVYSIAADDKDIYWLDLGTNPNSFNDGSIRHCPIDASGAVKCTVTDGEVLATSDKNPRVIVMDDKAVYWTVQLEGAVYRLAR
jgi:hypothetical protein